MYSIGSERGEGSGLAKGEAIKDTCQGDLPSSQVGVMLTESTIYMVVFFP